MDNHERLGELVKQDRLRLYRTVDKARAVAQLSRGAWDNVEKGRPAKDLTYFSIELALEWKAGSCRRVLEGGDPSPSTDTDYVREVMQADLSEATRTHILRLLSQTDESPPESPEASETA